MDFITWEATIRRAGWHFGLTEKRRMLDDWRAERLRMQQHAQQLQDALHKATIDEARQIRSVNDLRARLDSIARSCGKQQQVPTVIKVEQVDEAERVAHIREVLHACSPNERAIRVADHYISIGRAAAHVRKFVTVALAHRAHSEVIAPVVNEFLHEVRAALIKDFGVRIAWLEKGDKPHE